MSLSNLKCHAGGKLPSWQMLKIFSLLLDHQGRLWVGSRFRGLYLFQGEGKGFVHYGHNPQNPDSMSSDAVWGLAEDLAGNLWVATYGAGLNRLATATGKFEHYAITLRTRAHCCQATT